MKDLLGTKIVNGDLLAVPHKKRMHLAEVLKVCKKQVKVEILDEEFKFATYYHGENTLRVTEDPKVTYYFLKK